MGSFQAMAPPDRPAWTSVWGETSRMWNVPRAFRCILHAAGRIRCFSRVLSSVCPIPVREVDCQPGTHYGPNDAINRSFRYSRPRSWSLSCDTLATLDRWTELSVHLGLGPPKRPKCNISTATPIGDAREDDDWGWRVRSCVAGAQERMKCRIEPRYPRVPHTPVSSPPRLLTPQGRPTPSFPLRRSSLR